MKTSDVVVEKDKEKRCLGRRVISLVMLVTSICMLLPNEVKSTQKLSGNDRSKEIG